MPLPTDMGACIRKLRKERPEMKGDQRVAICMDVRRKAGLEKSEKPKKD